MYLEIPQGKVINIQGLNCWLPPEGYVYNNLIKQLEYTGVYKRSEIPEEQYWERTPLPKWYKEVTKKEDVYNKYRKEDDPLFYDEKYEEYKRQEWFRRLNGFWLCVYNPKIKKSEAVYLTGFYYMLLQWFNIDIGFPKFIFPHLHKTYFLQYCIEDPICMGMIDVTKRRFLKTFMGGLFLLEYITRTKMVNGAIQSKTGKDGKNVFSKAVVYPFRKFPRFFRPEYDMSLGINPKTEIRFQQTNIRGKKAEDNIDKEELGSMIDWGSADAIHFDGSKIQRYFGDEWAKTTEANIFDRHEVIRYCLLDEEGKIIGKALYSSTVEKLDSEKDGVQEAARLLWDASDQNNREENGMTQSGLYRFFQTADEGRNFDIYGYPNVEQTIKDILADRKSVENSPRALMARTRKEPRTIREAFSIDDTDCPFNSVNINHQLQDLQENPVMLRVVRFFRDPATGKVKWVDDKNGFWEILEFPKEVNKVKFDMQFRAADNIGYGLISIDGYTNTQGGKYGSKAGAYIMKRYDILDPDNSFLPVAQFFGRPKEKSILHEQIMMASEYYGILSLWEHVADEYKTYYQDRGRLGYLMRYPWGSIDPVKKSKEKIERHFGYPTTEYALTKALDAGVSYFENHCHKIKFSKLLEQSLKFDPKDRTKSDLVVAFINGLVGLQEPIITPPVPKTPLIRIIPNVGVH